MGKKEYKSPKISVINIDASYMLASSFRIDNTSQGDFKEDFVRGHRGTWGNLWSENDKK